jgi:hypothetical protein
MNSTLILFHHLHIFTTYSSKIPANGPKHGRGWQIPTTKEMEELRVGRPQ